MTKIKKKIINEIKNQILFNITFNLLSSIICFYSTMQASVNLFKPSLINAVIFKGSSSSYMQLMCLHARLLKIHLLSASNLARKYTNYFSNFVIDQSCCCAAASSLLVETWRPEQVAFRYYIVITQDQSVITQRHWTAAPPASGGRQWTMEAAALPALLIYHPSCSPLFSNPIIFFCDPFTRHHLHQIIWRCAACEQPCSVSQTRRLNRWNRRFNWFIFFPLTVAGLFPRENSLSDGAQQPTALPPPLEEVLMKNMSLKEPRGRRSAVLQYPCTGLRQKV